MWHLDRFFQKRPRILKTCLLDAVPSYEIDHDYKMRVVPASSYPLAALEDCLRGRALSGEEQASLQPRVYVLDHARDLDDYSTHMV